MRVPRPFDRLVDVALLREHEAHRPGLGRADPAGRGRLPGARLHLRFGHAREGPLRPDEIPGEYRAGGGCIEADGSPGVRTPEVVEAEVSRPGPSDDAHEPVLPFH